MGNIPEQLRRAMAIDGAMGVALVDQSSGMTLGVEGGGTSLDIEIAAAGSTEVVRSKLRVLDNLGTEDRIEDILVTLTKQYHLLRPLSAQRGEDLFLYLVLSRERGNLALARRALAGVERELVV